MSEDEKKELDLIKEHVSNTRTDLAILTERVTNWLDTTEEYRIKLYSRIEVITEKINQLPCRERRALYTGVTTQLKFMWGIMVLILAAIIGEWVLK